jgi:uncharacterized membrane protein
MIAEALNVFMRWLHISSVAGLVGGMIYGRAVMTASAAELAPEARKAFDEKAARVFRRIVPIAIVCLTVSGVYNIVSYTGHTTRYHILLGIKLLLVAHIFVSAIFASQPNNPKRARQMASAGISGLVVIAISAYLRTIY